MPPKKKPSPRFPKKELNTWLKGRSAWNHDEWLQLLDDLRQAGFSAITDSPEGQNEIGLYLESNRK
jgi:hypothetical protein